MFKRVLLMQELGVDAPASRALAAWLARRAAELCLVTRAEPVATLWTSEVLWERLEARVRETDEAMARFRASLSSEPCVVHTRTVFDADGSALDEVFTDGTFDLVVFGVFADQRAERLAEWMTHALRVARVPVAWVGKPSPARDRPVSRLLCPVVGDPEAFAPVAALLRAHGEAGQRVTVVAMERGATAARWVHRWGSEVSGQPVPLDEGTLEAGWFDREDAFVLLAKSSNADVVVLPVGLGEGDAPAVRIEHWIERSEVPLLLVPFDAPSPAARAAPIDASDAVCIGSSVRVRIEVPSYFGRAQPLSGADVAFVWHGRVATTRTTQDGLATVERSPSTSPLAVGICRVDPASAQDHPEPATLVECDLRVIGPGASPLTLVDARTDPGLLHGLEHILLVRCGTALSFADIRAKMAAEHIDLAGIVDDNLVLSTGPADDIPSDADDVRLVRVALHLRDAGIAVASVRTRGARSVRGLGIPVSPLSSPAHVVVAVADVTLAPANTELAAMDGDP
ncbi:MAG: hypothetical protein WCJ30_13590, partial [Deltaproteobacteria bacterium]